MLRPRGLGVVAKEWRAHRAGAEDASARSAPLHIESRNGKEENESNRVSQQQQQQQQQQLLGQHNRIHITSTD